MSSVKPKYAKEEFARRGEEIFDRQIAEKVCGEDPDRIVAIDIDSGDFEVDDEILDAVERLRKRKPEAQVWLRRVGSRSVMHFGGIPATKTP